MDAARAVLDAGAHGLTVHPRPDLRHIRPDDVESLRTVAREANVELNVEGNPFEGPNASGFPGYMKLVEAVRPEQATLVPDDTDQATSGSRIRSGARPRATGTGLSANSRSGAVASRCLRTRFRRRPRTFATAAPTESRFTPGPTAEAAAEGKSTEALALCRDTAAAASAAGLGINAGHDLDLENLPALVRAIPDLDEVSIGHALTADALWFGWKETIRRYLAALA